MCGPRTGARGSTGSTNRKGGGTTRRLTLEAWCPPIGDDRWERKVGAGTKLLFRTAHSDRINALTSVSAQNVPKCVPAERGRRRSEGRPEEVIENLWASLNRTRDSEPPRAGCMSALRVSGRLG